MDFSLGKLPSSGIQIVLMKVDKTWSPGVIDLQPSPAQRVQFPAYHFSLFPKERQGRTADSTKPVLLIVISKCGIHFL
jgi:hypothetical protein